MIITILLFIIILLILFSIRKKDDIFLSRTTTDTLKGFSMCMIVIHHMLNHWYIDNIIFKYINIYAGYLFTGLFFTMSGYGIALSLKNGKKDIKYILKKILNIYLSYVFFYFITIILMNLLTTYNINIKNITFDLLTIKLPLCSTWFIKVLIICYIAHFCFYKLNKKYVFYEMMILIIIYTILCIQLNIESKWYLTVYGYAIGIIIAYKRDIILKKLYNMKISKKLILIVTLGIIFVISVMLSNFIIGKIISINLFSIIVISVLMIISLDSRILKYIGKYTLDIYLSHLGIIYILDDITILKN